MGKPTICIGENKGADQLRSDCEADQHLCFRYKDSTIPLFSKSKISSLYPSSVTVQPGLCQTCSEPKLLVFSCTGSFLFYMTEIAILHRASNEMNQSSVFPNLPPYRFLSSF